MWWITNSGLVSSPAASQVATRAAIKTWWRTRYLRRPGPSISADVDDEPATPRHAIYLFRPRLDSNVDLIVNRREGRAQYPPPDIHFLTIRLERLDVRRSDALNSTPAENMMEQWHLGNAGRRQDDHVHTNRLLEWPWPIRRQVFHRDATPVVNVTHNNLDNIPKPINSIDLTEEIPNVLPHCLRKGPRSICDLRAIHWMADHVMSANTNHQFERSVASFFFYLYLSLSFSRSSIRRFLFFLPFFFLSSFFFFYFRSLF